MLKLLVALLEVCVMTFLNVLEGYLYGKAKGGVKPYSVINGEEKVSKLVWFTSVITNDY